MEIEGETNNNRICTLVTQALLSCLTKKARVKDLCYLLIGKLSIMLFLHKHVVLRSIKRLCEKCCQLIHKRIYVKMFLNKKWYYLITNNIKILRFLTSWIVVCYLSFEKISIFSFIYWLLNCITLLVAILISIKLNCFFNQHFVNSLDDFSTHMHKKVLCFSHWHFFDIRNNDEYWCKSFWSLIAVVKANNFLSCILRFCLQT